LIIRPAVPASTASEYACRTCPSTCGSDGQCKADTFYGTNTICNTAAGANQGVEAEVCFQRAIDIARRQQSKAWQLRATTSLARLWQGQGRREEAQAALAAVYGGYTEGFTTPDLVDARALLESLAKPARTAS